jgi:hypothetical protein
MDRPQTIIWRDEEYEISEIGDVLDYQEDDICIEVWVKRRED